MPASLSHGPSRELFTEFAKVAGNMVVLTAKGETGSLSRLIFDRWSAASGLDGRSGDGSSVGAPIDLRGESLSLQVSCHSYLSASGVPTDLSCYVPIDAFQSAVRGG